jgi:DNA-binding ferritin-like protein
MKMSKVAKMIGVDRRTIYNWVTHESLEHLFSEGAKNEGDRELSEQDIFVINTINYLRQNMTTDWDEIAERIEEGYQVTDLSIGAVDVDTGKTPLQQFTRTLAIAQERDAALKQLEEAQKELREIETRYETKLDELRDHYEAKLEEERKRGREDVIEERKQSREEMERLLREIAELRYEIGKLESNSPRTKKDGTPDE